MRSGLLKGSVSAHALPQKEVQPAVEASVEEEQEILRQKGHLNMHHMLLVGFGTRKGEPNLTGCSVVVIRAEQQFVSRVRALERESEPWRE